MSKEEPAWKAELEASIDKIDPYHTEDWLQLLAPHIKAAEQRGFQAGVNKTGDSVGKLREQLKTAKQDAAAQLTAMANMAMEEADRIGGRTTPSDPKYDKASALYAAAEAFAPDKQ